VRFLADESCDFAVVRALNAAGHDVSTVSDLAPAAEDHVVAALAEAESRILLTEDKDFGQLAYATGLSTSGVVLIRYPAHARSTLGAAIVAVVAEFSDRLIGAFVVVEPGRARLGRPI
jgi:predicted nuclease of predicted toxin-antitoxin system